MAGRHPVAVRGIAGLLAISVCCAAAGLSQASPVSQSRRFILPALQIPVFSENESVPGVPDSEDSVPEIPSLAEIQELVLVGNDNDGKPSRFSVRSDSNGRATYLEYAWVADPQHGKVVPLGAGIGTCNARGPSRLDRRKGCGIELEHARGETSATRLFSPDLDPATGGTLVLIYLRHYAIFGEHQVSEYWMRLKREGDVWKLYAYGGPETRSIGGLFLHRASRGIGSITACLDRPCPGEWSRRDREHNEHLPPIWGQWSYWASR